MSESVIDQEVAGDSVAAVQELRPQSAATAVANPSRVLLDVRNLSIGYDGTEVVHGVNFSIDQGESLALVGQSGSGKSTIAGALLRLGAGEITDASASIELAGESVIGLSARKFRKLLRSDIAYIPQFPLSSLNPTRTVRYQLRESFRAAGVPRAGSGREALEESLLSVGILEPARVLDSFPHQLSGGQLQRVLIAMAIAKSPKLIIADEPTSALDISLRRSILDLIRAKQEELGSSVLLITHDLSVARALTHTALILNHGRVVESGPSDRILEHPESEYGRMLLASIPEKNVHRYDEARAERRARVASAPRSASAPTASIVSVQNVSRTFGGTRALVDASIAVEKGTTFALVGESGSGKTTLARAVLGLVTPDEGTITVDGTPVDATDVSVLRTVRRHLQFVYQDGTSSLDPRYSALRAVAEPLQRFGIIQDRGERLAEATRLLTAVGLPREIHGAKPRQLSGGQRQRVAIARAIALRPDVVVLDEPTSALDVSVQAQIIDLLIDLQSRFDLTYILVSHDLGLVRQFADTVAVMRGGRILETGPVEQIFERPSDPFTVTLIANSLL